MMASHGRGRWIGRGGWRALGLAALMAASGGSGLARAGQIDAGSKVVDAIAAPTPRFLDPASLVPEVPPLTPTTVMATAQLAPGFLPPSAVANPPAADGVVPKAAPATVSTLNTPSPTTAAAACICTCPNLPPSPPPVVSNPPPGSPTPPQPLTPPPSTPEPTSIVSALAMVGAAVVWRRRARRVG